MCPTKPTNKVKTTPKRESNNYHLHIYAGSGRAGRRKTIPTRSLHRLSSNRTDAQTQMRRDKRKNNRTEPRTRHSRRTPKKPEIQFIADADPAHTENEHATRAGERKNRRRDADREAEAWEERRAYLGRMPSG